MMSLLQSTVHALKAAHETGGVCLLSKCDTSPLIEAAIRPHSQHLWLRVWFNYSDLVAAIGESEVNRLLHLEGNNG